MDRIEESLKKLEKIRKELDDAMCHLDEACIFCMHYDEELAKISDLILDGRNRLQDFTNFVKELRQ
jgi:hypothetical protein